MNRTLLTSAICTLAGALIASADVPSLINYQGRLTDSSGAPVTGSKTFAISIYDAATAGNLLYSESIGAVTLDSNGVYSFQFGNAGTSNTQVTETIGTTAGSTLTYTKTLSNTPVLANSITVTDGTNSWSQSVGNPGVGATATANTIVGFVIGATITNGGSGYTSAPAVTITGAGTGATATATLTGDVVTGITINSAGSGYTGAVTITIAPPVIPFRVDYSSGAITATYSPAPAAGRTITATYRYGTSGITGALSSGAEHWMAISVDGVTQGTRQRVLAVPFSAYAKVASTAEKLAPQTIKWRPEIFSTYQNGSGSSTLPFGGANNNNGIRGECVIPQPISSLNSLYFKYAMGRGYYSNGGADLDISIIENKEDGSEAIVFKEVTRMLPTDPAAPGMQSKISNLSLDFNSSSFYKIRVSMSISWSASVNLLDVVLTGKTSI